MCFLISDSDFGSEDEELALQHVPNGNCIRSCKYNRSLVTRNILGTASLSRDDLLSGKPSQKEEKSIVGKHSSLKPETSKKTHSKSLEPSKEDEDDDSEDDDESDDEDSSDESDEVIEIKVFCIYYILGETIEKDVFVSLPEEHDTGTLQ